MLSQVLTCWTVLKIIKNILTFWIVSRILLKLRWNNLWNNYTSCLSYIVNTMPADVLGNFKSQWISMPSIFLHSQWHGSLWPCYPRSHGISRFGMDLLPDTQNYGLHMRRECRERFPRHRRLAIPTCVTHVPWCMLGSLTSGFLWSQWWRKVPGITGTCVTRNFAYLVRCPLP